MNIDKKLAVLGVHIPNINPPAGSYVSYKVIENTLYVSGQTARVAGKVKYAGKLGEDLDIGTGKKAARVCIENMLCQRKQ
jgi:enamine deaminase RidA (YjgF/YER057c/UK114 family)